MPPSRAMISPPRRKRLAHSNRVQQNRRVGDEGSARFQQQVRGSYPTAGIAAHQCVSHRVCH